MHTSRTPRIVIEDLPPLDTLSMEEMVRIFGAGRRARLELECLEARELMASGLSASLTAGTLTIQDGTASDTIRVRQINNQISVDGVSIATATGNLARVAANQVTQVRVLPLGGHDLIDLDSQSVVGQQPISDEVFIQTGPGGDTIRYGGGKTFLDAPTSRSSSNRTERLPSSRWQRRRRRGLPERLPRAAATIRPRSPGPAWPAPTTITSTRSMTALVRW